MDTPLWMRPVSERQANKPLDVQSRGRPLSQAEEQLANALESLFAKGCHDFAQIAVKLSELKVVAPVSGSTSWSLESLCEELSSINTQLDTAFEEHGYGA